MQWAKNPLHQLFTTSAHQCSNNQKLHCQSLNVQVWIAEGACGGLSLTVKVENRILISFKTFWVALFKHEKNWIMWIAQWPWIHW